MKVGDLVRRLHGEDLVGIVIEKSGSPYLPHYLIFWNVNPDSGRYVRTWWPKHELGLLNESR